MAKRPSGPESPGQGTPQEFPDVSPRDLYPTSDIRFVMIEVGKLTASVDRLVSDVRSQGERIDGLRQQSSFVKGAIWVAAILIPLMFAGTTFFIKTYFDVAVKQAVQQAISESTKE